MRRSRPRDQGADALGQRSRRRRGRHPHSPDERGRGWNARRPARRSLYFSHRQTARVLPARRRRPLLPGADLDGAGLPRRRIQRSDARWNRVKGQRPGRRAIWAPTETARQGHASAARSRFRRPVRTARCRDATEPHSAPARALDGVRLRILEYDPPGKRWLLRQDEGVFRGPRLTLGFATWAATDISAEPRQKRAEDIWSLVARGAEMR